MFGRKKGNPGEFTVDDDVYTVTLVPGGREGRVRAQTELAIDRVLADSGEDRIDRAGLREAVKERVSLGGAAYIGAHLDKLVATGQIDY